ncbi:NAD(P)-dependent dehydrogenase (short-subunit alcohol dehydrogenase family) [Shimia isoporae]|uniref:Probable oxidoreductase n=1 Tax=Shimia isoporae TaxID=647720 RepID=A0A4V2Q3R0_9RHOB|nr:oxidoreductase [Shimia isoporae]TCL08160.1 NAD(P)-dependent dehydrogenase (short-subunit alcohol dehydrogenase family) [Shimia isoporae]
MAKSDQVPVEHGFGPRPEAADVVADIDLGGKTAVVTGGYSGLGLETVRALAGRGAQVIVPVRTPEKAEAALADVAGDVVALPMDLSEIKTISRFANELANSLNKLDLLINNAGIMACPMERVGPGWESQFGVNHMGHFALTQAMMGLLSAAEAPRVVSLSSTGHKLSPVRWDDIQYESTEYDKWQAYGQAKTANALFANALSRRLKVTDGLAFSVHPGGIFTPLQRHLPKEEMIALGWLGEDGEPSELAKQGFKTPEQGAATSVWAATSPLLEGKAGVYCEDCNIASPTDPDSPTARYFGVDDHATDDEAAERLWAVSEALLNAA